MVECIYVGMYVCGSAYVKDVATILNTPVAQKREKNERTKGEGRNYN